MLFGGVIITALLACAPKPATDIAPSFANIIASHGASPDATTLVILRETDQQLWVHNTARAERRYSPASTSKIPHTLIALETGAVTPETRFGWDGRERAFTAWNQDQTLRSAYARSAAWVYQIIVAQIGAGDLRFWLETFDYSNADIGTGAQQTQYWLTGPLEISAREQVNFPSRTAQKDWTFSESTYSQARELFLADKALGRKLFAKTGWFHDSAQMDIGWYVGWTEDSEGGDIYVFALNMDMPETRDAAKRKPVMMAALRAVGAWPGAPE